MCILGAVTLLFTSFRSRPYRPYTGQGARFRLLDGCYCLFGHAQCIVRVFPCNVNHKLCFNACIVNLLTNHEFLRQSGSHFVLIGLRDPGRLKCTRGPPGARPWLWVTLGRCFFDPVFFVDSKRGHVFPHFVQKLTTLSAMIP